MIAISVDVEGLQEVNYLIPDEEIAEKDPEFYRLARKNPLEYYDCAPEWSNVTATGFYVDENTERGRELLIGHLTNDGAEYWGEYFCENCTDHAEIYGYDCKNCCTGNPKTCGVSNWGAPWKRRTHPADKWDNYRLGTDRDAPTITGEYTEKIMTDWGVPYPKD